MNQYRTLPQRSIVSRLLPQRSVASRNIKPAIKKACCLSDSYDWGDLIDKELTFKKRVKAYNLPSENSEVVAIFQPGDTIQIYSFVNTAGRTWLMFYLNPFDFDNFNASYIPTIGAPASGSAVNTGNINEIFEDPGILTNQEKDLQNEDLIDKIGRNIKNILLIGSAAYVIAQLIKK